MLNEEVKKYRELSGDTNHNTSISRISGYLDGYEKALEKARWIPCCERFPEVGSEVLVCYDFKGKRSVYIANFYGDGDFHGLDDEYLTSECRKNRKAVAWMPLPEPYKASPV